MTSEDPTGGFTSRKVVPLKGGITDEIGNGIPDLAKFY